ncbi:uncharacterized protein LOC135350101 [Halichondria panicea]|uniref:uncharacterized protein LOC135350101 n=1 Tax=Halichondria panicea TaxID=6063 RepID=UPI00312BBC42
MASANNGGDLPAPLIDTLAPLPQLIAGRVQPPPPGGPGAPSPSSVKSLRRQLDFEAAREELRGEHQHQPTFVVEPIDFMASATIENELPFQTSQDLATLSPLPPGPAAALPDFLKKN